MTREEEEARERLRFQVEMQTGFWLALVIGNDRRPRARLREAVRRWCALLKQPLHLHTPPPERLPELAERLVHVPRPGLHWILTDVPSESPEAWQEKPNLFLRNMNGRRDAYFKHLKGGIILEGRSLLKRQLRVQAPDLFSIRACIAEPGAEPVDLERISRLEAPSEAGLEASRGVAEKELARASRLVTARDSGSRRTRLSALILAVGALLDQYRWEEAEGWVQQEITLAEALHCEQPTDAWGNHALLQARLHQGEIALRAGHLAAAYSHFQDVLKQLASSSQREALEPLSIRLRLTAHAASKAAPVHPRTLEVDEEETFERIDALHAPIPENDGDRPEAPPMDLGSDRNTLALAQKGCLGMGIIAQERGAPVLARPWYESALKAAEVLDDWHARAMISQRLGTTAQEVGQLDAAEAWFLAEADIYERLESSDRARAYELLGTVAQDRGDLDAADAWFRRALAVSFQPGSTHPTMRSV